MLKFANWALLSALCCLVGCGGGGSGDGDSSSEVPSKFDVSVTLEDLGDGQFKRVYKNSGFKRIDMELRRTTRYYDVDGTMLHEINGQSPAGWDPGVEDEQIIAYFHVGSVETTIDTLDELDEFDETNNTATTTLSDPGTLPTKISN